MHLMPCIWDVLVFRIQRLPLLAIQAVFSVSPWYQTRPALMIDCFSLLPLQHMCVKVLDITWLNRQPSQKLS
jgi:hypothetical protein